MAVATVVLLLGHGIARFESAVGDEVKLFVAASLTLLVVGFAVRFWLDRDQRDFVLQRWFQILVQAIWLAGVPLVLLSTGSLEAVLNWSETMFAARVVASLAWLIRKVARARYNPAFVFVLSFSLMIGIGTLLLMLPICRQQPADAPGEVGAPPLVALFTAASAGCVTGLAVVDTGTYWTPTGQAVILLLIQMGGLGVMTFGGFFALGLRRGFLMRESVFMGKLLEADDVVAVRNLVRSILLFTLVSELIGTAILFTIAPAGPLSERLWFGAFHSVSAFCNAGFGLLPKNLEGLGSRWQVWGGVAGLIIIGGLGFDVLRNTSLAFRGWLRDLFPRAAPVLRDPPPRLSITSRLVLSTTAALLLTGTIAFFLFERSSQLGEKSVLERIADAWFQSVSCRTAGFNTIDFSRLQPTTLLVAIALMFIGASPGSTGGGVKTVVFSLTVLATVSVVRGRERLELAGRTIAEGTVQRAAAVIALALAVLLTATLLVVMIENQPARFLEHLFETTSALGTVGLSTGITASLRPGSQVVLIATMFLGRVGPLTVLLALAQRQAPPKYEYPTERVMLG
jgi:trk system potassium uptake protein TrkH